MNAEAKFVSSVMDARLKKAKAFDLISNSYTTEIKQALKNKELNQCLFLLEQILDDLEANNER